MIDSLEHRASSCIIEPYKNDGCPTFSNMLSFKDIRALHTARQMRLHKVHIADGLAYGTLQTFQPTSYRLS